MQESTRIFSSKLCIFCFSVIHGVRSALILKYIEIINNIIILLCRIGEIVIPLRWDNNTVCFLFTCYYFGDTYVFWGTDN